MLEMNSMKVKNPVYQFDFFSKKSQMKTVQRLLIAFAGVLIRISCMFLSCRGRTLLMA
jgi:hypothetical protein